MSRHPTLHRIIRRARRVPGYTRLRRSMLRRLRSSGLLKEVVSRIYSEGTKDERRIPRTYPPPGNLLRGLGTESLPVVVVSLVSIPENSIDEIVDEIARIQLMSAAFRPVFVMDAAHLDSARRYGYAGELLLPSSPWPFPGVRWIDYATNRVAEIHRRYDAIISIAVPPEGVPEAARLLLQSCSRP